MDSEGFLKAADKGDAETVRIMLDMGMDPNLKADDERGRTALIKACRHGHEHVVLLLLLRGADVNRQDNAGDTALAYAACNGYLQIVRILLEHGADTGVRNQAGRTVMEEVGFELLAKNEMSDAERASAQKLFWEFITLCREYNKR